MKPMQSLIAEMLSATKRGGFPGAWVTPRTFAAICQQAGVRPQDVEHEVTEDGLIWLPPDKLTRTQP